MVKLSKREIFAPADFDQHPIWAWDDEHVGYLPISEEELVPAEYEMLFIKARFATHAHEFSGFLIGRTNFHAFGLFVVGKLFSLNIKMADRI